MKTSSPQTIKPKDPKSIQCTNCNRPILLDAIDWSILQNSYWTCSSGVVRCPTDRKPITHSILGEIKGLIIDHINRDNHDNRRQNLRYVTHAFNAHNAKIRSDNTSGYKGVYFVKSKPKTPFRALIVFNQKRIALGYHETAIQAAVAYNNKAKELYGENAVLNII